MNEFYKHYITINSDGYITDGWSDGPHPERDTADAICINEQGGYQFRLVLNGQITEEGLPLRDYPSGILLYKWDGTQVVKRTEEELAPEREAWWAEQNRLQQIAALKAQLSATDYQAIKYAEGWLSEEEFAEAKALRQSLRDQINALEVEAPAPESNG